MRSSRGFTLGVLVLSASVWAWLFVVVGLLMTSEWAPRWPGWGRPLGIGGLILIGMGEFLFAAVVADRLFPRANPVLSGAVELAAWGFIGLTILIGVVL